jgi:hypothetical protein
MFTKPSTVSVNQTARLERKKPIGRKKKDLSPTGLLMEGVSPLPGGKLCYQRLSTGFSLGSEPVSFGDP